MNQKAIVTEAARKYGVDPKVLWGLYGTETSFGKNVSTSSAGAVGPFQFLPSTAKGMGVNPYDFKSAAFGAARYLSQYKNRGVGGMLSAYNAGPAGGYQSGYVNTTLANAKSYGGGGSIQAPETASKPPALPGVESSGIDQGAFQKAQRAALVGKLIASTEGAKAARENPLIASGLASTRMPQASEYAATPATPALPGATSLPKASPQDEPKLAAIVAEADHIAQAKVPYLWGGGHQGRVLAGTKVTPLDCSGAVSAALGINPKVSGEFESWGAPGKGAHVTIYANSKHVLMEVNGRFWGTSGTNPGGGAGWIKAGVITPEYLKSFTARHPAGEQIVAIHQGGAVVKTPNHTLYVPR